MFRAECSGISHSACCLLVSLCIFSCLLWEEAALTLAEEGTQLQCNRIYLESPLLINFFSRTVLFGFTLGPWSTSIRLFVT